MSGQEAKSKNCGKLDITIPEQLFEAGKKGVISILIKNPFDNPIVLIDVVAPQSTTLAGSSEQRKGYEESDNFSDRNKIKRKNGWLSRTLPSIYNLLTTPVSLSSLSLGIASVSFDIPKTKKTINISAEKQAEINFNYEFKTYDEINVRAEESSKITFGTGTQVIQNEDNDNINIIQPHSEIVRYLNIQSKGWLLFKPIKLPAHVEISYRLIDDPKETVRSQIVSTSFEIRPPLLSNILGSIAGSILGTIAKELQSNTNLQLLQLLLTITTSVVMSLIATVALSRKTDSQGFITVEDFYGGFVLGALIGYTGSRYFEQAIFPNNDN